eukprot:102931_1
MGNLDTPDSMVVLIFTEIVLIQAITHFTFIIIRKFNLHKSYSSIIQIKFIKFTNIRSIKQYLRIIFVIWSVIFDDCMGLMHHITEFIRNVTIDNVEYKTL